MDKGLKFAGKVSFIVGIFIVTVLSIANVFNSDISNNRYYLAVLVMLGTFVGIVNIKHEEYVGFLIAFVTLFSSRMVYVNSIANGKVLGLFNVIVRRLGDILVEFVDKIVIFLLPAAVLVGLRAIFEYLYVRGEKKDGKDKNKNEV